VKVPIVAIVVSFQFPGPRPSRPRWLATDRRRSTRTPKGPARSRGQPGRDFLVLREEWTRSGQGKKVVTGCCGGKSEAALKRRRPTVRHAKSRTTWACQKKRLRNTNCDHQYLDRGKNPITAHRTHLANRQACALRYEPGRRARCSALKSHTARKVNPQTTSVICAAKRRPVQSQKSYPRRKASKIAVRSRYPARETEGAGRRAAKQGAAVSALIAG
jgi:hypothetical protein